MLFTRIHVTKKHCLLILLVIAGFIVEGQNLIRNHSFENGFPQPNHVGQIHRCNRWKTYRTLGAGSPGTSDWFKGTPNGFQGTVSCGLLGELGFNQWPFVPLDQGNHYAGFVRYREFLEGEGIQQQLPRRLETGRYSLQFDYLLTCDTAWYALEVYFGAGENHCSYLATSIPVPTVNVGQWQTFSTQVIIPNSFHQQLDWFILLNTGQTNPPDTNSFGAYMYLDNFHLNQLPCTNCDPDGLISWNQNSLDFLSANNDGIYDSWCMTNINNVSWFDMQVIDRWGAVVYEETGHDGNGYENFSLCWDGRDNQGTMQIMNNWYNVLITLGNCGTQHTTNDQVYLAPFTDWDTTVHPVANYVPPLFGSEPSPTHYRELQLYGGYYYGTHDWYACDSIILGGGEPLVPYFWAASTSKLGFYFSNGFDTRATSDVRFDLGADIDIQPMVVHCCPQYRLANPDSLSSTTPETKPDSLDDTWFETIDTDFPDQEAVDSGVRMPDVFTLQLHPNPADETIMLSIHIPARHTAEMSLWTSTGIKLMDINPSKGFTGGEYQQEVSVKSLPAGFYVLRGQSNQDVFIQKFMVIH
jgi:gliding motility-associated-like protein